MSRKVFVSLRAQLAGALLGGIAAAVGLFLAVCVGGGLFVYYVALSPQNMQLRGETRMTQFQQYVTRYEVSGTDPDALRAWVRSNRGVSLRVSRDKRVFYDSGSNAMPSTPKTDHSPLSISIGAFGSDQLLRSATTTAAVQFSDGVYRVVMQDLGGGLGYLLVFIFAVGGAVLVFLLIVLRYHRRVTRSVIRLSEDVNAVRQGQMSHEIRAGGPGELDTLAHDVDSMRTSIITQMQRETAAWQANRDLITSLSHDLRTPLTALIGYLNLMAEPDTTDEERRRYAHTALEKAMRIKTLSDELFRYFTVYARPKEEVARQPYDAQILMEQLIGERTLLLEEKGYRFRVADRAAGCRIAVNVESMQRVMDNLFSNLEKYADPAQPIVIFTGREKLRFCILFSNTARPKTAESTQIGVSTCRKLIRELDGEFVCGPDAADPHTYITRIFLPLLPMGAADSPTNKGAKLP